MQVELLHTLWRAQYMARIELALIHGFSGEISWPELLKALETAIYNTPFRLQSVHCPFRVYMPQPWDLEVVYAYFVICVLQYKTASVLFLALSSGLERWCVYVVGWGIRPAGAEVLVMFAGNFGRLFSLHDAFLYVGQFPYSQPHFVYMWFKLFCGWLIHKVQRNVWDTAKACSDLI